ncbi:MAG: hypothetical protein IJN48_04970 [Clostridia bacterium]|nr:hypothetical protein [Clostridia bacterium]
MDKQFEEKEEKQSLAVRVILSVARVALIIGLLFYVLYHLTNGFSAELETETVNLYSMPIVLNSNGIIVRNEVTVANTSGGVVSYRYENGKRVGKDAKIAVVYGSGDDAATVARVAEIDATIDFLEDAGIGEELTANDGIAAGKEISSILLLAADKIGRGDYGSAVEKSDDLLEAFLKRNAAIGGDSDSVSSALASLTNERGRLAMSLSGVTNTIKAPVAGYFYDYADGGEGVFDYQRITSLTPEEYRNGLSKIQAVSSLAAGKIVTVPKWYFVCPMARDACVGVSEGNKYDILFSLNDMTITMTLEAKNVVGDEALLVFSTKDMPSGFDFTRQQKVSVVTDTVSGYRVPSSALRVVDGTVGVYIRSGNTVRFRVAQVIYESGSYSYISTETEGVTLYSSDDDETNDVYCKGLALYDNVIVSGANELYPDRIVN